MHNFFEVNFHGQVILVPKRSVTFENGLGIVEAYAYILIDGELSYNSIVGVVDENFEVVVDYRFQQALPKINIMGNGNLICLANINEGTTYPDYRVVLYNYGQEILLNDTDYRVVDDDIVLLKLVVKGVPLYSLFSFKCSTQYAQFYNYVGDFKFREEFQEEVADAEIFVPNEDGYYDSLAFYINKKSEVVSSYKYKDEVFDASNTLEEVLNKIKESQILN